MSVRKLIEAKLGDKEFIFDPNTDDLAYLKSMMRNAMKPVCHRCGKPLEVALTIEEARRTGNAPGVFCVANPNHCQIAVGFAE